jgi:hypothetical protein
VWAHELTAAALYAEAALGRISSRPTKPNEIYHAPLNYPFAGGCIETPAEDIENTAGRGEGVHYQTAATAVSGIQLPAFGNCGFTTLQPRRVDISKPSASELGSVAINPSPGRDGI